MGLREELKKFCASTSMKGIPRAINSDRVVLRVLWTVAVLALFGFVCYQTYTLISGYLQYAVVTSYSERSSTLEDLQITSPIITVCTQNIIPETNFDSYPDIISPSKFLNKVSKITKCHEGDDCEQIQHLEHILATPEAYFQYLGVEKVANISHKKEHLFADCKVIMLIGTSTYNIPCKDYVSITKYYVQYFFTCFDIKTERHIADNGAIILGIDMILYLDNANDIGFTGKFNSHSFDTGLLAMITNQGVPSSSVIKLKGIHLPVGNFINMSVHPKFRRRESDPYGKCTNYTEMGLSGQYECLGKCFEGYINHKCDCVEPALLVVSPLQDSRPYCFSIEPKRDQIIKNTKCRQMTSINHSLDCLSHCGLGCKAIQYEFDIEANPWPQQYTFDNFYYSIIENKPYAAKFEPVLDIITRNCSDSHDCEIKLEKATRILRNNFVRMTVRLTDQHVYILEDVKKTQISELLSNLGGALNLWSGITVIVILEILELIYRLLEGVLCAVSVSTGLAKAREAESGEIPKDQ